MMRARFHNALRILRAIDQFEMVDAKVTNMGFAEIYEKFAANPYRWFIHASDDDAEKVWQIIERRQGTR